LQRYFAGVEDLFFASFEILYSDFLIIVLPSFEFTVKDALVLARLNCLSDLAAVKDNPRKARSAQL